MHRSIEILIGRLVTDEDFRDAYERDPEAVLNNAITRGLELTPGETNALLNTERLLWRRVAEELDPRLQKASLRLAPDTGDG